MHGKGTAWWHSQFSTYCAWLPGDKRGFRSLGHRIHSSGNYRSPPPIEEHRGLREYHQSRHPTPIVLQRGLRLRIACAIAETLIALGFDVRVVAVADRHAHVVARLPIDRNAYANVLGKAKSASSRAIRKELPGQVWARGDRHDLIGEDAHYFDNAFGYVRDRQGPGAAVWCADGLRREAARD